MGNKIVGNILILSNNGKFVTNYINDSGGVYMIYAKEIADLNHVKRILDNIKKNVIAYENIQGEVPEEVLENITFQLCEIEEFIIGPQKYTATNIDKSNLRMMGYWKYIEGNYSFWDMIREMKKYEGDI